MANDNLMLQIPVNPEATCARISVARSAAVDRISATVLSGPIADCGTSGLIRADEAGRRTGAIQVKDSINEAQQQDGADRAE